MPEYTHTLIPARIDFVADPKQVGDFLTSLVSIGAAPSEPEITAYKLSGKKSRSIINPFTKQEESYPLYTAEKMTTITAVASAIHGLAHYNISMAGKGPPKVPAFQFDFKGRYAFLINCCLRPDVVSTSDWHDEAPFPVKHKVKLFGKPCSPENRLGIFHNPNTLEIIEVQNAGCARFWIEFESGKMLFPPIEKSLVPIESSISDVAESIFGTQFVQGCRWCA